MNVCVREVKMERESKTERICRKRRTKSVGSDHQKFFNRMYMHVSKSSALMVMVWDDYLCVCVSRA